MAQIVISDAGPLIALAKIDHLFLLEQLFGCVLLPAAVQQECLAKEGMDGERIQQAIETGILQVIAPAAEIAEVRLPRSLGEGEKAAIRLVLQQAHSLLIVDDQAARRQATKFGLTFIGTVRLLDIAEKQGLLEDAEQTVLAIQRLGYRISTDILRQIRQY